MTGGLLGCYVHSRQCYVSIRVTQFKSRVNTTRPPSPSPPDPRIAFFDQHAPTWDTQGPDPAATLRRLRELDGRLGLRPGQDVLEVGCGTGQITGWLVDLVKPGRVVAADFSPAMLEQARARGWAAEFRHWDICVEQPVAERFDVVLCFHSFPHFRDPAGALRQMARLLKPGGELVVMHLAGQLPVRLSPGGGGGGGGGVRLPPAAEWPALLQPAGLCLISADDRDDLFLVKARLAG